MDYNQSIYCQNRLNRKQFSQLDYGHDRNQHRLQNNHRFSEPKTRLNLIKINKSKLLPLDFFRKKDQSNKLVPPLKPIFPSEHSQFVFTHKKAQSQRLHYSPQKTSFFGFVQDQDPQNIMKKNNNGGVKFYNRKFQTRDQPKRDAFPVETARKLTTARNDKNQLLQLFPSTHDQQIAQIIISSSKTKNIKLSPRKQLVSKLRQPQLIIDPQKQLLQRSEALTQSNKKCSGGTMRVTNVSMQQQVKQQQFLNITFFNAKSSCFPPINRPANN